MKKAGKFFLNLFIYIALVVLFLWGAPKALSYALGTPYPMATITSGSMWPVLKEGDLIFIKKISKEELKIGDIVVWQNPQGFTIHRVVKLDKDNFVTRGDANFKDDKAVAYNEIVGRPVILAKKPLRIPYVGFIAIAASKR